MRHQGARVAPIDLWDKLAQRFALIGVQGIVRMAMCGFEVACWDALANAAGMPLATFLGGATETLPRVQQLRSRPDEGAGSGRRRSREVVGARVPCSEVAARLSDFATGHRRAACRAPPGDGVAIMVDYNQALTVAEALERGRALDREGIVWLEEPIRHDDYAGCAMLARELKTPIQIGENFSESHAMATALAAGAADYVMPDLERIGGVAGWQRAAGLAAAHRIEMSSHLFPEVSAHLLAATPTAHWLEWVDWAEAIVEEPLVIEDGFAIVPDRAGNGPDVEPRRGRLLSDVTPVLFETVAVFLCRPRRRTWLMLRKPVYRVALKSP